jgi:hypothetical protein
VPITIHKPAVTLVILLHRKGYCKLYEGRARALPLSSHFHYE